ncbi:MAG: hypothetical protein ACRDHU_06375 [Actinomycetota bacterium]
MATPAAEVDGEPPDVCPSCGLRYIEDPVTGFCEPCAGERAAESYLAAEAGAIAERRSAWVDRTAYRRHWRERQNRKRLLERVRPREPAPPHADPFVMAQEALMHLAKLRGAARRSGALMPHLEAAEELIRQLAWGPTSGR